MSKHFFTTQLFLWITFMVSSQTSDSTSPDTLIEHMGTEGVYVHYTHNVMLTGEYVHYKLYTLAKEEKSLSSKSKMAYIELLDQYGNRKIIQKVKLQNGTGKGDFFLPTSLESGYYTLTAYTRYMLNWPSDRFFRDRVVIINPYTNNQEIFLSDQLDSQDANIPNNSTLQTIKSSEDPFIAVTNKDHYKVREMVNLKIISDPYFLGNYSISVRKASESLVYKENLTPEEFNEDYRKMRIEEIDQLKFLPELRGELISGKLATKQETGAFEKQRIFFSIPGDQYEIAIAETDEKGEFQFSLNANNLSSEVYFQVANASPQEAEIILNPLPSPSFTEEQGNSFSLKPEMKQAIEERSIHNQIENAYFEFKPDTVLVSETYIPFYGSSSKDYNLDEYTRFNSFKETLVEIVDDAWVDTDKDDRQAIFIRDFGNTNTKIGYKPLVIVDGLVVKDHEDLIAFAMKNVKTIRLVREQVNIGGQVFQGIFDVITFNNEFLEMYKEQKYLSAKIKRPQPAKQYFRQQHTDTDTKIPDFRHQLLWKPDVQLKENETEFNFFTSDIPGIYEVSIEGFTTDLKPVKFKTTFVVE
ncbi:hypothetical protein [Robertkochia sediminum]|uniref:hypothetical protein n=1 Tax=Robertkochia sediminum TaxID=2785326 RepID=UPI0019331C4E|nr:hypothetical protein [Robertkochia sediminum]MBL7472179.1 hypothetical protein [Robertkochia sediminum]